MSRSFLLFIIALIFLISEFISSFAMVLVNHSQEGGRAVEESAQPVGSCCCSSLASSCCSSCQCNSKVSSRRPGRSQAQLCQLNCPCDSQPHQSGLSVTKITIKIVLESTEVLLPTLNPEPFTLQDLTLVSHLGDQPDKVPKFQFSV